MIFFFLVCKGDLQVIIESIEFEYFIILRKCFNLTERT